MPQHELIIQGESIQGIYNNFVKGNYFVNRQYQRKLVWSLQQKQYLIDSIYRGYPIPLILLTGRRRGDRAVYEIIDGLQRLDAIVAFIQGEFKLDMGENFKPEDRYQYFDLKMLADTMTRLNNNQLEQKHPTIDPATCNAIANYKIPFSIYSVEDASRRRIDSVFKRVNTSGKQLTNQEIRQGTSLHPFAELVRHLSSAIRGDIWASNILGLENMKQISISEKNSKLDYGIMIEEIPWRKHRILEAKSIRQSQDEVLVARLLSYMLIHEDAVPSSEALDRYYKPNSDKGKKIIDAIHKRGTVNLEHEFLAVYDEVQKLIDVSSKNFSDWVFKRKAVKVDCFYEIIFLAIYELFVREKLSITNYNESSRLLNGLADRKIFEDLVKVSHWGRGNRLAAIKKIVKAIKEANGLLTQRPTETISINIGNTIVRNILEQSKVEPNLFEFMISCYPLEPNLSHSAGLEQIRDIYKTLTAIANEGPGSIGYVVIGITKSYTEAEEFVKIYHNKPITYKEFIVTGIQNEAVQAFDKVEAYYEIIRDGIELGEIVPNSVKQQIKRDITLYDYHDKYVLVFRVEAPHSEPCRYDNQIYARSESRTFKVPQSQLGERYMRFNIRS